jgi:23S rRNA (cytosine1962-C5)-methyltransferase
MRSCVAVTARGMDRLQRGHPWIYRSDLAEVSAEPGAVVRVLDPRRRPAGYAFFSDRSQIALRMLTRRDEPPDIHFWRERLARALQFRAALDLDATAYRLVHGEADLLPALIVDRYGEYLVIQTLSQGTERLAPTVVQLLVEQLAPRGILARNDPRVRLLEGLEPKVELLHGDVPDRVLVREGGVGFEADLWRGQKTGLFLDQRENRTAAVAYAHGRLLDCFSYNGGFALRLAPRCTAATAIDVSEDATARTAANAAANGMALTVRTANVFDALREMDRGDERFETIVLDPPAFAKNRDALPKALAGYKEINLRALKLLSPGGVLVTCTCSYHVDEPTFASLLHAAALDAGSDVSIVEKRMQGRDHPVLLGVPETHYLKCFILRKLA